MRSGRATTWSVHCVVGVLILFARLPSARADGDGDIIAAKRSKVATIPVGSMPVGIEISPDGRHAFVANTNDNKVTVIEVKARKAIRSFTTGNEPDGMAWAP
mgnify:CR=1 FL=1